MGPTAWSWGFGDGVGTSTLQNPSYTYQDAGTYTVTLVATNACGSDTETLTDYIVVSPSSRPRADFVGEPTSGCRPLTVAFTSLATGVVTGYQWKFGDGTTSTLKDPTHTYSATGSYTVRYRVTGPNLDFASD